MKLTSLNIFKLDFDINFEIGFSSNNKNPDAFVEAKFSPKHLHIALIKNYLNQPGLDHAVVVLGREIISHTSELTSYRIHISDPLLPTAKISADVIRKNRQNRIINYTINGVDRPAETYSALSNVFNVNTTSELLDFIVLSFKKSPEAITTNN